VKKLQSTVVPKPLVAGAQLVLRNRFGHKLKIVGFSVVTPEGRKEVAAPKEPEVTSGQTLTVTLPKGASLVTVRFWRWDRGNLRFNMRTIEKEVNMSSSRGKVDLR